MSSKRSMSRIAMFTGGAAIVAMSTLASCSTTEKEAPSTPPATPTTSAPSVTPTEKAVGPDSENSFSPSIHPAPPGSVCKEVHNGVCVR